MSAQKDRRRSYFIDRKFQGKFILRFCGLVVLGSVISGIVLYLFSRGTVTTTFVNSRLSVMSTTDFILPALLGSSLATITLISIATALVVMYLSHRLAGPLFRIEKSIEEIENGNLSFEIHLRLTDQIGRMANRFNSMVGRLKTQISRLKNQSQKLSSQLDTLNALAKTLPAQAREALKKISETKKELDRTIDYFKT